MEREVRELGREVYKRAVERGNKAGEMRKRAEDLQLSLPSLQPSKF